MNAIPTNLRGSVDDDGRIVLSWDSMPGALDYPLSETTSPDGVSGSPIQPSGAERVVSLRGPFTTHRVYTYSVRARYSSGTSEPVSVAVDYRGDPTPSLVPATHKLVGRLNFDNGNLSQWQNLQTKDRNGAPGTYCTHRACVRDGGPGHPSAARFQVDPGDVPSFGGHERSEVRASSLYDVREGDDTWYLWSTLFEPDPNLGEFRPATGWGLIFMQWHSFSGSPPLSLHAEAGQISVQNDRPGGYTRNMAAIEAGVWHDFGLHIVWSRDNAKALTELYRGGVKLGEVRAANIVGTEHNYLKMGIYRAIQDGRHVLWHDGVEFYRA